MISLPEVGGLYQSTPANIKDARTKAFMYACDRQIKKLLERAEKVKVWCDVDSVDEKYLDYMAVDCHALLYDSNMDPGIKRNLIKNSHSFNMTLGTRAAMQEILNNAFPGNETIIKEWFEYDGEPFYFKIVTDADMDEKNRKEFIRMISTIKNARSILEGIDIIRNIEQRLYTCGVFITESHISIGCEG